VPAHAIKRILANHKADSIRLVAHCVCIRREENHRGTLVEIRLPEDNE
jgi:hypothetical protein